MTVPFRNDFVNIQRLEEEIRLVPSCDCVKEYGDYSVLRCVSGALMNYVQLYIVVLSVDGVLWWRVQVELEDFKEADVFIVTHKCQLTICYIN